MGQQEAHGAVMKLIRMGIDRDLPSAHAVNRLRRKTERWNDVILAHLGNDARLFSFAVDRDRLKDFRGGQSVDDTTAVDSWPLFLASISKAFPIEEAQVANPLLNSEIFRAVSPVLPAGRSPMRTSEWVRPLFADRVWQRLEETSRQMDDWLESYLF